jgi:V8-like Glu-specific endopeptidase
MVKKKYNPNRTPKRPNSFGTPVECIRLIKKSVYLVARGRIVDSKNPSEIKWFTIGTACVVAPNRMITAAHVISDPRDKDELKQHKEGDRYYLIKCDDEGNWHYRIFTPELEKELFVYPEVDLAVIYLEEEFYQSGAEIYALKDDYIRIDQKFRTIGTEIAVLGYPLCKLDFINRDVNKPQIGNILLRVDTGVVNSRYRISENVCRYEFTIAFNPGNSGGPIFDVRTGQLLSIVHGYRALSINVSEHILSEEDKRIAGIQQYTQPSFIDVVHANYSSGFATPSFIEIFKKHRIID